MAIPKKKTKGTPPPAKQTRNLVKQVSNEYVDMSFKVEPDFRKEFRTYASELDISQKDLLMKAFYYFRDNAIG